jgi:transglutaminase-like putative cysteine protease
MACTSYGEEDDWDEKHADESDVDILYSYYTKLNPDYSYTENIRQVKRIQNEDAMSFGEIPIVYDKKRQSIKNIKAFITAPDGKRYRYKMIQDVDVSSESAYSDNRKKINTMPNVVKGSTIEYEYTIFNKYGPIKGEYFDTVNLYSAGPFRHIVITLDAPDSIQLYFKNMNTRRDPEITRAKARTIYKWEFKDDDIYDENLAREAYTPAVIEFLPITVISTMKDWSEFSAWYWKEFSKNIVSSEDIRSEVLRITGDKKILEDKIMAVARYLYDNYRYVAMNLNEHNYEPHPANEVFKNKFGDCKDQTALLITMLKEMGIEAYPVLVCGQTQGNPAGLLPSPAAFDHLIAGVNMGNKIYFIDPLVEGYRFGETPYSLEGSYTFIVDSDKGKFIQMPFMELKQKVSISRSRIKLRANGDAVAENVAIFDRQASINTRKSIKLATKKSREDMFAYLENLTQGGKLLSYKIIGEDKEYGFLAIWVKTFSRKYLKPKGSIMFFGDSSISLVNEFYYKERKYPLKFYAEYENVDINEFIIPQGFMFEYIPPDINLESKWLDVSVKYSKIPNSIKQVMRQRYKRADTSASEYKQFRELLQQVEDNLNECIVIRKIKQ